MDSSKLSKTRTRGASPFAPIACSVATEDETKAVDEPSSTAIKRAGAAGLAAYLKKQKIRFHIRTLERIVAWSATGKSRAHAIVGCVMPP